MSEVIKVPDIGGGEGEVIEILVKEGDTVEAEQSLVVLESDKASMEVPCPKGGVVKSIKTKLGDNLKEGDSLIELDVASDDSKAEPEKSAAKEPAKESEPKQEEKKPAKPKGEQKQAASKSEPVKVPDLGSDAGAKVIEILVSKGDKVEADQSLLVLESDKASMELPAPFAGVIESIEVKLEQDVKTGDLIMHMQVQGEADDAEPEAAAEAASSSPEPTSEDKPKPAQSNKLMP